MKITTTSRHYDLTPALKEYAESKIENLTTYFDQIVSAHIIFKLEKYTHFAEVTLHINGKDLVAHDASSDMYMSVDRVVEKIERQLLKHKGKRYGNKATNRPARLAKRTAEAPPEPETEETTEPGVIIPADPVEFPMLELDEALQALKLNGQDFSIFSNRSTNRLNVLYKREDGTIGIIEA